MIIHYKKSMLCVILMSIPLIGMDQYNPAQLDEVSRTKIEKDERLQQAREKALCLLTIQEYNRPDREKNILELLTKNCHVPHGVANHVLDYEHEDYRVNIPTDIGILIDKGCISLPAGHTVAMKKNGDRHLTIKEKGKRKYLNIKKQHIQGMKNCFGNFVTVMYCCNETYNQQLLLERASLMSYDPHFDGVSLKLNPSKFFLPHSEMFSFPLELNEIMTLSDDPTICLQGSIQEHDEHEKGYTTKEYTVALLDDRQGFVVMCDDKLLPVFPPVVTNVTSQNTKPSDAGDSKTNNNS